MRGLIHEVELAPERRGLATAKAATLDELQLSQQLGAAPLRDLKGHPLRMRRQGVAQGVDALADFFFARLQRARQDVAHSLADSGVLPHRGHGSKGERFIDVGAEAAVWPNCRIPHERDQVELLARVYRPVAVGLLVVPLGDDRLTLLLGPIGEDLLDHMRCLYERVQAVHAQASERRSARIETTGSAVGDGPVLVGGGRLPGLLARESKRRQSVLKGHLADQLAILVEVDLVGAFELAAILTLVLGDPQDFVEAGHHGAFGE